MRLSFLAQNISSPLISASPKLSSVVGSGWCRAYNMSILNCWICILQSIKSFIDIDLKLPL